MKIQDTNRLSKGNKIESNKKEWFLKKYFTTHSTRRIMLSLFFLLNAAKYVFPTLFLLILIKYLFCLSRNKGKEEWLFLMNLKEKKKFHNFITVIYTIRITLKAPFVSYHWLEKKTVLLLLIVASWVLLKTSFMISYFQHISHKWLISSDFY